MGSLTWGSSNRGDETAASGGGLLGGDEGSGSEDGDL